MKPAFSKWFQLWIIVAGVVIGMGFLLNVDRVRSGEKNEVPISFDHLVFNFGTILQTGQTQHEFRLINHSDASLRIVGLRTTCSCTTTAEDLIGKRIKPHEAIRIPVTYDAGYRDGHVSSSVKVIVEGITNQYELEAVLEGEVCADFQLVPDDVDFGALKPGTEAVRTILCYRKNMKAL